MKKLALFTGIFVSLLFPKEIYAQQLKVTNTPTSQAVTQGRVIVNTNSTGYDSFDVVDRSATHPAGVDLIWGTFTNLQPNNPGLLSLSSANGARFVVKANGRVGIFNNNPSVALEIGSSGLAHQVKVNGVVTVGSDERLKDNIQDIDNTFSKLMQLRSVSYNLKGAKSYVNLQSNAMANDNIGDLNKPGYLPQPDSTLVNRTFYGFLAQDIQKQFPNLVYKDNKTGMLSVDYIGLIPLLLDALKEQQKQIEELKSSVFPTKLRSESTEKIVASANTTVIDQCKLYQNVPNPFTIDTDIQYYLSEDVKRAILYIYDMQGKQIKSISVSTIGEGVVTVSGSELHAGMYIYTLVADGKEVDTKRMILTE